LDSSPALIALKFLTSGHSLLNTINTYKALIKVIYIYLLLNIERIYKFNYYWDRKENGVVFTKTSELSERLPLPHTKGTKPAP